MLSRFVLLSAFMFAAAVCSFAQEQEVDFPIITANVAPEKVKIGEPVEYAVTIDGNFADVNIKLPEKKEAFLPDDKNEEVPLYIIESANKETSAAAVVVFMRVAYYRVGTYSLPELELLGGDGIKMSYKIPSVTIEAVNPEGKFNEAENPLDAGANYTRLILLLIGAALAGILAFLIVKHIKKRLSGRQVIPSMKPIETFMQDVDKLGGTKLISAGKIDEYSFAMSEIFRRFLSASFGFDASEMTTDEVRAALTDVIGKRQYAGIAEEVTDEFNLWDLAKFAEFTPAEEVMLANHNAVLKTARRISRIETTNTAGGSLERV